MSKRRGVAKVWRTKRDAAMEQMRDKEEVGEMSENKEIPLKEERHVVRIQRGLGR